MGKHLMFVDDDESFLKFVRHACKKLSQVDGVQTAEDGPTALDLLRQMLATNSRLPDVLLVDINMPCMSGFEFLEHFQRLRAENPRLNSVRPVAMLTSSDQTSDRDRAKGLGADDYIVKPMSLSEMRHAIARVIE